MFRVRGPSSGGGTRKQSQGPFSVSGNGEAVFPPCFRRRHSLDWPLEGTEASSGLASRGTNLSAPFLPNFFQIPGSFLSIFFEESMPLPRFFKPLSGTNFTTSGTNFTIDIYIWSRNNLVDIWTGFCLSNEKREALIDSSTFQRNITREGTFRALQTHSKTSQALSRQCRQFRRQCRERPRKE